MNLLTQRFPTLLGLVLLFAGIAGGVWFLRSERSAVNPEFIPQKVRISNTADNKFSVSWITSGKATGSVVWGKVGDALSTKVADERDSATAPDSYTTHQVTVTGLQPSTQYAFRITSNSATYDNNGSPYTVTTGPTITTTPLAKSFYGTVQNPGGGSVGDALVYLALPNAQVASVLVHAPGSYTIPLSTIRTTDLSSYVAFDPSATIATVTVETGSQTSTATVSLANSTPVPVITMGQNPDFRAAAAIPNVAVVEPATPSATPASTSSGQVPGIFNVQPLGSTPPSAGSVTLSNPASDGETIATTQPEFRGTGPSAAVLSITVHSVTPYSGTVTVANNGTWTWTPPANLAPGSHTVTINYIDAQGVAQTLERTFTVSKVEAAAGDPAFVSTPSASTTAIYPSPTPVGSPIVESTAGGRVAMPATGSGVPVTGIVEPTVLTGVIGFAIMVAGAFLLAL